MKVLRPLERRHTSRHRSACFGLALLAASTGVLAQPGAGDLTALPLEQLLDMEVATASRFQQKASRAPSAVRVITADEIRRHGWRTLAQALESLPGLYVSDDRGYHYLGARGVLRSGDYNTRFLLLVDGHRLNDPVYSEAPIGYEFPLDPKLIERIEYVPGPGSALYGSNAFFGVINVITRSPSSFGRGELDLVGGSDGQRGLRASVTAHGRLGETVLSADTLRSNGEDLFLPAYAGDDSDGVARGLDALHSRRLFVRHRSGDLSLMLVAGQRDKGIPTANYDQVFNAPGSHVEDRWNLLGVSYSRALAPDTDWYLQGSLRQFRYIGDYIYDVANRDVSRGRSFTVGSGVVTRAVAGHVIAAGVELNIERGVEQLNFDVDPYASYLVSRTEGERAAIYVNDEWAWNTHWSLSTGLRLDHEAGRNPRLSPRLALVGELRPGTTLKAIAGQAFRAPNAYERYYQVVGPGGQSANPTLGAEHIRTTELLLTQSLGEATQVDLSIYQYRLQDLITLIDAGDALTFENAVSARSSGLEAAVLHRWASGMQARASYAYADVRDDAAAHPVNSPYHLAKLHLTAPLGNAVSLALGSRFTSQRATREGTVGSATLVDAHLLWAVPGTRMDVSLGATNLFNRAYADPAGPEFVPDALPRQGRSVFVDVLWRF